MRAVKAKAIRRVTNEMHDPRDVRRYEHGRCGGIIVRGSRELYKRLKRDYKRGRIRV